MFSHCIGNKEHNYGGVSLTAHPIQFVVRIYLPLE